MTATTLRARLASGLALGATALMTLAACGGAASDESSDASAAASNAGANSSASADSAGIECSLADSSELSEAQWHSGSREAPTHAVVLTEQYPLSSNFSDLADPQLTSDGGGAPFKHFGITQYQDRSIGVVNVDWIQTDTGRRSNAANSSWVVHLSQDGEIIEEYDTVSDPDRLPIPFDLANKMTPSAYFQVYAADGVEIPATAGGTADGMAFATGVMPDAFEDEQLWVLMRGSSDVYKAELYEWEGSGTPGDFSQCSS